MHSPLGGCWFLPSMETCSPTLAGMRAKGETTTSRCITGALGRWMRKHTSTNCGRGLPAKAADLQTRREIGRSPADHEKVDLPVSAGTGRNRVSGMAEQASTRGAAPIRHHRLRNGFPSHRAHKVLREPPFTTGMTQACPLSGYVWEWPTQSLLAVTHCLRARGPESESCLRGQSLLSPASPLRRRSRRRDRICERDR